MLRLSNVCLNLCLAAASVALTMALAEGIARVFIGAVPFSLYPSARNCMRRSALMSQDFRPNCSGQISRSAVRTNAAGLRGPEIRDDGSIRILALGDSCTWGWQVAEEESYPHRLQTVLDERRGRGRYQVINAGVPGTTSYEGLRFLRARGLPLRPALLIVGYGFNDADAGGDVEIQLAREAALLPLLHLNDWLMDHSLAYKWARWRVWYRQSKPPGPRVAVDKYARNLTEIVRLSRAHGAAVVFLGWWTAPDYDAARARVANDLAVPLIRYRGPALDVVHPTPDGYRAFAAEILDHLTAEGTLERLRQPAS